jgi:exopolyphosphatase/guanosine-5'-triphosphate,3'-diphosphate pyrophosphatase
MQTVAAIDLGSNGIRMVVGSVSSVDQVEAIKSIRIPVRLGQDVFSGGVITRRSMQATLDAFLRFRKIADQFEVQRIRAIGTSAMREAENSQALIELILRQTGIHLEVISGEEESRLIHLAIAKALDLDDKKTMLIDIGGGSIEVTMVHGGRIVSADSYAMGTVRLLCRLDNQDDSHSFRALLDEYTESARRRIKRKIGNRKIDLCVGTGGNLEELGVLRRKFLKGPGDRSITVRELKLLSEKIGAMTMDERIKKLNLRRDRADVIVPAALVLQMIVKEAGVKEIQIPRVGLKDGLLLDMAPQVFGPALPPREQVWVSAMRLGQKYQFDSQHGTRVARTAGRLFDQTYALHGFDQDKRLLLEVGSILHDIGHFVNSLGHEQHGYYLIKNSSLVGLDDAGREIVAQLVRYHRKQQPSTQQLFFKALSQKERMVVSQLCALLRLADAIEVSHTGRVRSVELRESGGGWELEMHGDGDFLLEKWSLEKSKSMFEEEFAISLQVVD